MLKKIACIICILSLFSFTSFTQSDSCHLRISLLTCTPGEELYSTFGHTALRVIDNSTGSDIVYNYGTFDDSDPDFYIKFMRGIMNYALSVYPFADFVYEYQMEGRGVTEQNLRLNCTEKQKLYTALQINSTEANRFYAYYFHKDNCATRERDIVAKNTSDPIQFKNILPPKPPTYRELIHTYLDKGGQYWSKFGIDILFGNTMDARVNNEQAMFLPDYLMKGFDSALLRQLPLVSEKQIVLTRAANNDSKNTWFTPMVLSVFLLVAVTILSFIKTKWAQTTLRLFDRLFFFVVGLLGILMVLLWTIRVDDVCRNNFNVLWALPTNVIAAFLLHRKTRWTQKYFRVVFWISIFFALAWFFIPQGLNIAVGPIILLLILRSYHYIKKNEYVDRKKI